MAQFVDDARLGAVEHSKEDRLPALDDDAEDRGGNEQADDRVGKRIAEPHPDGAEKHRQTRPAVDARVVSVRDQRRAVDLLADANAEDGDSLVAEKADDRGRYHRAQIGYVLGMQKPLYALISRDDRARENREYDDEPCQILDAPIAESESLARLLAGEPKGNPERYRGRSILKIVNRVGKQRTNALAQGSAFTPPIVGRDRGIDDAVGVSMASRMIVRVVVRIAMTVHCST